MSEPEPTPLLEPISSLEPALAAPTPAQPAPSYLLTKGVLLLVAWFGLQLAFLIFFGLILMVAQAVAGGTMSDPRGFENLLQGRLAWLLLLTTAPSGVFTVILALWLGAGQLRSGEPTGYGLVPAASRHLFAGAGTGAAASVLFVLLCLVVPGPSPAPNSLAALAVGEPFERVVWLLLALVLAPPVEEVVFRGGLLAGFRSRLGRTASFLWTTVLFSLLHLTETLSYWPALIAIPVLAWLLAELRDRTGSLWPPMLAHFAYNAVLAITVQFG